MFDEQCETKATLRRIADTLGIDVSAFRAESGELQVLQEKLELLSLFESIVSPCKRRTCLAFVRAIAAHQQQS